MLGFLPNLGPREVCRHLPIQGFLDQTLEWGHSGFLTDGLKSSLTEISALLSLFPRKNNLGAEQRKLHD